MEREGENASLRSPLIQISGQDGVILDNDTQQNNKRVVERREILEEVTKQLWLAGPLISVGLLNFCIQIISVMFVGHLGELPLSGASMATSFASVTGLSLLMGMASALDTLCGQSYGAKQHRMLGIHMQRAMLVLMIVSIPLAVVWVNTRSILIFFGQDPQISAEAGKYAQLLVPSLFAYGILQCLHRFLQTQNIVFPMVFSSGATTLLHLFMCWVMVFKSGLGSRGAAIANSISHWINVLILTLYVKFSPSCAKSWTGFSKAAFHNIHFFLSHAIPSAIMLLSLNTGTTAWMVPYGLGAAVSTRVSNELGAGRHWTARLALCVVLVMAIIEGALVGILMILIRNFGAMLIVMKYKWLNM
ncbi:Protein DETOXIFICATION 16, partial [Mucuna pruriens]